MKFLLLGAGFSRNWGGWLASEAFEFLLGHYDVASNEGLRRRLWKWQSSGGFEAALGELQREAATSSDPADLRALESAILAMFEAMNDAFYKRSDIEFSSFAVNNVKAFLARFDAIFTLNQDLFLEHHYCPQVSTIIAPGKFNGAEFPGMRTDMPPGTNNNFSWAHRTYFPDERGVPDERNGIQPIYKLHGSSNWRTAGDTPMVIIGADKMRDIAGSPLLSVYHQRFEGSISRADARLLIIGYGFRDPHINEIIVRAIQSRSLKCFIIGPDGAESAVRASPAYGKGGIPGRPTDLEDAFERGVIGASRRPLSETFGDSGLMERSKLERFLSL